MNSSLSIEQVINHARTRSYMDGVQRNTLRVKQTQEVFTPTAMVQELLDQLPQEIFSDPNQNYIDNSCGDGQFLSEALIRKVENGIDFETALSHIYGVDMMQDNIELCRQRLLCGREDLRPIVEKNIVCADAIRYHYRFDGSYPYDDELKTITNEELKTKFFYEE
jgi:type I restriction-modification system DNA methylase subunit